MTVEAATARNSGVSLEVGATYHRPAWAPADGVTITAIGDIHFLGCRPNGRESCYAIDSGPWVRVVPTPADRYVVIDENGSLLGWWVTTEQQALADARTWNANGYSDAPLRVARYTFAEWIDTEAQS